MTETEVQNPDVAAAAEPEPTGPQEVNCRHCGQPNEVDVAANPDWQCPACERYQDAAICPTCGGLARISVLPAEMQPPVHEPTRRRKAKE